MLQLFAMFKFSSKNWQSCSFKGYNIDLSLIENTEYGKFTNKMIMIMMIFDRRRQNYEIDDV